MKRHLAGPFRAALIATAVITAQALPLHAQSDDGAIEWRCVQERDAGWHVSCIARADQPVPAPVTVPAAVPATVPTFMGRDMRPVAARGVAEALSSRAWRIPLHAPPSDRTAVASLLGAVLCGDVKSCRVNYEGMTGTVADNGFGR